MNKHCSRCHRTKSIAAFSKRSNRKCGLLPQCKQCDSKRYKRYCQQPGVAETLRQSRQRYNQQIKLQALQRMGVLACEYCGCRELAFLTVDHRDNNGAEHRQRNKGLIGSHMYQWILKAAKKELTKWRLRVLCFNCNCAHLSPAEIQAAIHREHRRIWSRLGKSLVGIDVQLVRKDITC